MTRRLLRLRLLGRKRCERVAKLLWPVLCRGRELARGCKRVQDRDRALQRRACLCRLGKGADIAEARDQVRLPLRVPGVGGGELFHDGETRAEYRERLLPPPQPRQCDADTDVAVPGVALPFGVARLAGGELFDDGESAAECSQRLVELAGTQQQVAEPVVRNRQIVLIDAMPGIGGDG